MTTTTTYLDRARADVLAEVFTDSSPAYWHRRADALAAARTRPGDFTGQATPEELTAATARLNLTVLACRQKAAVLEKYGLHAQVVREIAAELAEAS